jgi:hypothetical protein
MTHRLPNGFEFDASVRRGCTLTAIVPRDDGRSFAVSLGRQGGAGLFLKAAAGKFGKFAWIFRLRILALAQVR